MAYTKATNKAVQKYSAKAYDRLAIRVKKGKSDIIKEHAEKSGESLNGFVNRAIDETIKRDNEGNGESDNDNS